MFKTGTVAQPFVGRNIEALKAIVEGGDIESIDVAAAYATESGVEPLLAALEKGLGNAWSKIPMRWVLAFDYCRTQPTAADQLSAAPKSSVRIHDAKAVIARRGAPRKPFHPKTFMFRGADRRALFTGSGNLSRSGLINGHEVGVLLDHRGKPTAASQTIVDSIVAAEAWFDGLWKNAAPHNLVAAEYRSLFESQPNLKNPTPTEDDTADFDLTRGGLKPSDLVKLRVCNHFWIEAGNITKNLGKGKPGNQLMMKRMSRVFFGIPAYDVQIDSHLGDFSISFNNNWKNDCSLTFSNNGMDKITLPTPGVEGPVAYDQRILIFTRLGYRRFLLEVGGAALKSSCRARSEKIEAAFKMSGADAREFGVY